MAGVFDNLIRDAYGSIGRVGIGTNVNQIDQEGYDYWLGRLESGDVSTSNFRDVFNNAVDGYINNAAANDPLKSYILDYRAGQQSVTPSPSTTINPGQTNQTSPQPTTQPTSNIDNGLYNNVLAALINQNNSLLQAQTQNQQNQQNQGQENLLELFQPNLYPRSGSENESHSISNNESNSTRVGGGESNNRSGIDWDNPFVQEMTGLISTAVNNLPQNIENWTQAAVDKAEAEARTQARTMMPGILNSLQRRGILNSSVSEKVLSDVLGGIAENTARRNYDAAMKEAEMKKDIPSLLGRLAELGRQSSGSSINWTLGSSHSQGNSNSQSNGYSFNENPLAPYQAIMNMFLGMGA